MLKNNISFQSYQDVNDIIKPLQESLKLYYFGFARIFPNNKFINLASDLQWPEYQYLTKKLPPACFHETPLQANQIMMPKIDEDARFGWPENTINDIQDRFNITQPILLVNNYANFYDLFVFEFKLKNSYEFFFNNYNIIENFIFYFKDKAHRLIKEASSNPLIILPDYVCDKNELNQMTISGDVVNLLKASNYYLYHNGIEIILKNKQYQILSYISLGLSNKNISERMYLSPRTIDDYVNTLIQLFSVKKKSDLIAIYYQNHSIIQQAIGK